MVTHKSTRDLVKLFSPQNVVSLVEQVHPNRDWPPIWALVFHPLLCNSLKSFSWRSTHNVLPTRSKLLKWRLGDGGGPFWGMLETSLHVFWECASVYGILIWVNEIVKRFIGLIVVSHQYFLCTVLPSPDGPNLVWDEYG